MVNATVWFFHVFGATGQVGLTWKRCNHFMLKGWTDTHPYAVHKGA
jgi:hypothetical protein